MGLEMMEYITAIVCVIMVVSYVQITMWKDEGALASVMYFIFQFWYGRYFVNKKLKTDNLK